MSMIGYMPRGPDVAIHLCIVSTCGSRIDPASQVLFYFHMSACSPFLKNLLAIEMKRQAPKPKHSWDAVSQSSTGCL